MRSIRELMEEHERLDNALRAKFRDSVEGLEPIIVPEAATPPEQPADEESTEEIAEFDEPTVPESQDTPLGDVPDVPEAGIVEAEEPETPSEFVQSVPGIDPEEVQSTPISDAMPDAADDVADMPELEQTEVAAENIDEPPEIDVADVPDASNDETPTEPTESPVANEFEQPELPVSVLESMPAVDMSSPQIDRVDAPRGLPVGFQGYNDFPDAGHQHADVDTPDEGLEVYDERVNRQLEREQRDSDDLAESLARELGPAFDEMRESQSQTVRDYVAGQQLISDLLRVRR